MKYKAKFTAHNTYTYVYIDIEGEYLECYDIALHISHKLNMEFTGILEENESKLPS